jgi:hypothetical protein
MDFHPIKIIEKKQPAPLNSSRGTINTSTPSIMETTLKQDDGSNTISTITDERPMKIQRLKQDDTNAFIEEHKSSTLNIYEYDDSRYSNNNVIHKHLDRLQTLMQHFNQSVTPYTYNNDDITSDPTSTTTNIDLFAHECSEIIKLFDWTQIYHIDCMMIFHQLHGTLFLWLSYIITSHIPWDVTNIDCFQVHRKLVTSTNHICTCLVEIYRITPHLCNVPLPSIESFLILYKTLLFLTKPLDRSKPVVYKNVAFLSTLFEVIDCTLHHVDCIRGLSSYEFQQFLLCLVQASSQSLDITSVPVVRGTSQIARQILEGLKQSIHESDSTFATFVQVASTVVSDPNLVLIERSEADDKMSPLQVFRICCVLQLRNKQPMVTTIVDALHDVVKMYDNYPSSAKLLILDCIVAITSSRYKYESEHVEINTYRFVSDVLVHVLVVSESNSTTYPLKAKAIEAMQNLFEDNFSSYILDDSQYENLTIQRIVASIYNMCIQPYHGAYQDDKCNTGIDDETNSNQLSNFPMEDCVLGATEVLLAILSHILNEYGHSSFRLPVPYVMNMCSNLLNNFSSTTRSQNVSSIRYPKRNQHLQYLIVYMIDKNIETLGLYIQTYPALAVAMANVVKVDRYTYSDENDPHVVMTMQRMMLNDFMYLLQMNRSVYQSILGSDCSIAGAISSVVVNENAGIATTAATIETGERNQEIAIELLCILSEDVFNRSMMAKQANLLSCMIRYLRSMDIDDTSTATTKNTIQRDRLKQCITQLSKVL